MRGMKFRASVLAFSCAVLTACGAVPTSAPRSPQSAPRPVAVSPTAQTCLAELNQTGSRFSPLPDHYEGRGCAVTGAVQLSAVRSDTSVLGVSNIGPVECETARVFLGWARFGVDRAARQILGSPIARIETMGSYACRNVAGTSRRSAHATAQAIDIGAFVLEDGRRISVNSAWSNGTREERRFLRIVHESACKRFGTVLGPDYNDAHRDHLHLEIGGGGFCR
jgi:hypothetical protein